MHFTCPDFLVSIWGFPYALAADKERTYTP
jgi:hypothetical protein